MSDSLKKILSKKGLEEVDQWIAKYPSDQKQSAVMRALMLVQEEHGYLTKERMDAVALYLEMPPIAVYEVSSFYSMYEHEPIGDHRIDVCTNVACKLRGSSDVLKHLEEILQVKCGETTKNNKFTLRTVECLGACVNAPMMQIDRNYHENLTPEKIDTIIKQYAKKTSKKPISRDKNDD